jgi:hypothetical protein
MGREDVKLLEMVFSHFAKKLRIGKLDGKLLEMLLCWPLLILRLVF